MSRKIVAERDWYPLLKAVMGAAVYINVVIASIVPTPLLRPREYWLIGWADHLTLVAPRCCHCRVLCFVPVLRVCVWYVCCYVRKKALLQCLCNYWKEGCVWGAVVYVFVGFWDGEYVSHGWYYIVVMNSFKHAREDCESKRAYVF